MDIDELGDLAMRGNDDLEISTMCATFAETEIVSLMAQDLPVADIASSVHRAIAARTLALVAQVGKREPVVLTGGVAQNPAAVHFLSRALRVDVGVPAQPQITGAYGAALLAMESDRRGRPVQDVTGADDLFPVPITTPPGTRAPDVTAAWPDRSTWARTSRCAPDSKERVRPRRSWMTP